MAHGERARRKAGKDNKWRDKIPGGRGRWGPWGIYPDLVVKYKIKSRRKRRRKLKNIGDDE